MQAAEAAAHDRDDLIRPLDEMHAAATVDAVAFVHSTEEVAAIVSLCAEYQTPIIAFGTGTSLEGHVAALRGGVCIDLSQMNAILSVQAEDLDCTVQAGVKPRS